MTPPPKKIYCGMPGSPCLSKTGLILARIFKRVTGTGGSSETLPRWHATICTSIEIRQKTKRYAYLSEKKIPLPEMVRSFATWPFCYHQYVLIIHYLQYFINETVLYRYDEFITTIMQLDFLNRCH